MARLLTQFIFASAKHVVIISYFFLTALIDKTFSQCSSTNPCRFDESKNPALTTPTRLVSSDGTLAVTLDVRISTLTFDWLKLRRRTYNGRIPGPTLRVKRGDTLTVNLINHLSVLQKEDPFNEFRLPNSTNLYLHGLYISSAVPQNNVFINVAPGDTHTYTFRIDSEQPAGTYWYHPILHGSSMLQVQSGMAGVIIVEDPTNGPDVPPPELAYTSCPDHCANDIEFIFQPVLLYVNDWENNWGFASIQRKIQDNEVLRHAAITTSSRKSLEGWLEDRANRIDHFTTNGLLFPQLGIIVGYTKRFRMVNAGGSRTLELLIIKEGNFKITTGCAFREIAFDGVYLDKPRKPPSGSKTLIPPSGTVDWLIVCHTPGTYEIRSIPSSVDANSLGIVERHDELLFKLVVTGADVAPVAIPTVSLPPQNTHFLRDFSNLTENQIYGRYVIEASPGSLLNRAPLSNVSDYRFISNVGEMQEWYLTNTDPVHGYPIHISTNHFQVISYNRYTGPLVASEGNIHTLYAQDNSMCYYQTAHYAQGKHANISGNPLAYLGHEVRQAYGGAGTLGYVPPGEFRSVIMLPPLVNITIRFLPFKAVGDIVVFSTTLGNKDQGMTVTTKVIDPKQNRTIVTLSGFYYVTPAVCGRCDPFPFNMDTTVCRLDLFYASGGSDFNYFYLLYLLFLIPITICLVTLCYYRFWRNRTYGGGSYGGSDYVERVVHHKKIRAKGDDEDAYGSRGSSR